MSGATIADLELTFGMPFIGFNGAQKRHMVMPGEITGDSLDWLVDNVEGRLVRRWGQTNTNLGGITGILEVPYNNSNPTEWLFRCREMQEFRPRDYQIAGKEPTFVALWSALDDRNNYSPAQIYWLDTLASGGPYNRVLGYSVGLAAPNGYPDRTKIWAHIGDDRCGAGLAAAAAKEARARVAAGSRNFLQIADELYMPNYGTPKSGEADTAYPCRWNKDWPDAPAGMLGIKRVIATGLVPPLYPPQVAEVGTADQTDGSWKHGQRFWVSIAFENDRGEISRPFLTRMPNAVFDATVAATAADQLPEGKTKGFGLVTLTFTGAASVKRRAIRFSNIPIGPPGTKRRHLLRSGKVDASSSDDVYPDIKALGVFKVLEDNTTTTYDSTEGDDQALTFDPNLYRYDQIMPPRAKNIWTFDHRIGACHVRQNPIALFLTPKGDSGSRGRQVIDDTAIPESQLVPGDVCFYVSVDATDLYLWRRLLIAGPYSQVTWGRYAINTAGRTIQDLVDLINAHSHDAVGGAASDYGYWYAVVAPGADGSRPASDLRGTGSYGDGFNTGAGGNPVSTAYDLQRCISNAWPANVLLKDEALDANPLYQGTVYFTPGGPGFPLLAANTWLLENFRHSPDVASGPAMGGASLPDGCVVAYANKMAILRNKRDGKTGVDEDYRIEIYNHGRGCICASSLVSSHGFVVYLSREGLIAMEYQPETGVIREINISKALYNPETHEGELAYEIDLCVKGIAFDQDAGRMNVNIIDSMLIVKYRKSGTTECNRMLVMDFSAGNDQMGLESLVRPGVRDRDGDPVPWGWSAPLTISGDAVCAVSKTSGRQYFTARDNIVSAFPAGRNQQWATGLTDDGTPIVATAYTKTALAGLRQKISAMSAIIMYRKNAAVTGLSVSIARTRSRATWYSLTLETAGTDPYRRVRKELPLAARTPSEVMEWKIVDDGTGERSDVWGILPEAEVLDSLV